MKGEILRQTGVSYEYKESQIRGVTNLASEEGDEKVHNFRFSSHKVV